MCTFLQFCSLKSFRIRLRQVARCESSGKEDRLSEDVTQKRNVMRHTSAKDHLNGRVKLMLWVKQEIGDSSAEKSCFLQFVCLGHHIEFQDKI